MMNNYKERYKEINKSIREIENKKQELEQSLMIEGLKLEGTKIKMSTLEIELAGLIYDRNKIIERKIKPVNIIINILKITLLVATLVSVIITYIKIAQVGIIKNILTILFLIWGYGSIAASARIGIIGLDRWLNKKIYNKIINKQEYKDLIEQICEKDNKIKKEQSIQNQIKEEQYKLTNSINNQNELIISKNRERLQLFGEILSTTLETPILAEVEDSLDKTPIEDKTKPYTRVKR